MRANPSDRDIITQFSKAKAKIIIVGEMHDEMQANKFLISNIGTFKAQGYDTIFLEGPLLEVDQRALDAFMAEPAGAPVPNQVKGPWPYETNFPRGTWKEDVVQAAKAHGMRIIALDTITSRYNAGIFQQTSPDSVGYTLMRAMAGNYQASKIINEHVLEGRRGIALVGMGHMSVETGLSHVGMVEMIPDSVGIKIFQAAPGIQRTSTTRKSGDNFFTRVVP